MIKYTNKNPTFSESILVVEPDDEVSAENNNAAPEQLLQNDLAIASILDPDKIKIAFKSAYPELSYDEEDQTAMSISDVLSALSTEWNGEASTDPTAMQPEDIEEAIKTT